MKAHFLLPFVAAVVASPCKASENKTLPFVPPGFGDSRSPCPGLNALANHGYLPHDGRNITGQMMIDAFSAAMNFDTAVSAGAVAANFGAINVSSLVPVDLEVFFADNVTDFRCNVAREDYQMPRDPLRVAYALAHSPANLAYSTPQTWGKVRLALEALTTNPPPYAGDISTGFGTGALMFMSTSTDSTGGGNYSNVQARKDWIQVFMGEDRFPVELGWKPQAVSPNGADLVGIRAVISSARAVAAAAATVGLHIK
ncbi:Peroxidase, family 2-domain-containing protein [Xylariales sp. PMI_506]|nr:Peroxidase, family 2-domain-containing protein [Xylariales sp. PMI_506]